MFRFVRYSSIALAATALVIAGSSTAFGQAPDPPAVSATVQTSSSSSSNSRHEGIGIGVKGGPLFSSINDNIIDSGFKTRTGWIGGLFIGGNRPGVVGVGVDILYARKQLETGGGNASFDYLEVPVLLRINAGSNSLNGVNFYGVVGPAFDVRLKSRLNTGQSLDDQTERLDVGLSVGAGVEITRFLIEGRYTKGFRTISKAGNLLANEKITTQSFAVMFGVRFN